MLSDDYRRKYQGHKCTLDGKPATIQSVAGGTAAAVVAPRDSGEASWYTINDVMSKRSGKFRLSRGHLAV
jgi:hypothetical protein